MEKWSWSGGSRTVIVALFYFGLCFRAGTSIGQSTVELELSVSYETAVLLLLRTLSYHSVAEIFQLLPKSLNFSETK